MISGTVNAKLQSIVQITLRGPQGQEQRVDACIDSGFNGGLTLLPETIRALGLVVDGIDAIVLANGEQVQVVTYKAALLLDGFEQSVPVFATGDFPLLGMRPLVGYKLCIDIQNGGKVSLERL